MFLAPLLLLIFSFHTDKSLKYIPKVDGTAKRLKERSNTTKKIIITRTGHFQPIYYDIICSGVKTNATRCTVLRVSKDACVALPVNERCLNFILALQLATVNNMWPDVFRMHLTILISQAAKELAISICRIMMCYQRDFKFGRR